MKALYLLHSLITTIWLNKLVFYTVVVAGCVIAFSPAEAGLQPQLNDKFLHATGFLFMGLLAHLAYPYSKKRYLIIGLSLLGLIIEIVQAYLPYREFSLWDWCADFFGVVLYFLVMATHLNPFFKAPKDKFVPD